MTIGNWELWKCVTGSPKIPEYVDQDLLSFLLWSLSFHSSNALWSWGGVFSFCSHLQWMESQDRPREYEITYFLRVAFSSTAVKAEFQFLFVCSGGLVRWMLSLTGSSGLLLAHVMTLEMRMNIFCFDTCSRSAWISETAHAASSIWSGVSVMSYTMTSHSTSCSNSCSLVSYCGYKYNNSWSWS